ncbi:hypothetical protein H6F61_15825 [Cyanobacteria bacterium FACHB-472]|nr:hypothetical protein [Cyanobacteria bacterium FACHB-472]
MRQFAPIQLASFRVFKQHCRRRSLVQSYPSRVKRRFDEFSAIACVKKSAAIAFPE